MTGEKRFTIRVADSEDNTFAYVVGRSSPTTRSEFIENLRLMVRQLEAEMAERGIP